MQLPCGARERLVWHRETTYGDREIVFTIPTISLFILTFKVIMHLCIDFFLISLMLLH